MESALDSAPDCVLLEEDELVKRASMHQRSARGATESIRVDEARREEDDACALCGWDGCASAQLNRDAPTPWCRVQRDAAELKIGPVSKTRGWARKEWIKSTVAERTSRVAMQLRWGERGSFALILLERKARDQS